MLKFLGKIGKGWATLTGVALTVIGVVAGAEVKEVAQVVVDNVETVVATVGATLALFGIGRKAGAKAEE